MIPDEAQRADVHRVIYEELCLGQVLDGSRTIYREIIASLVARGAQAVILGCTEIGLLVGSDDASVPLFDTTYLHRAECSAVGAGRVLRRLGSQARTRRAMARPPMQGKAGR